MSGIANSPSAAMRYARSKKQKIISANLINASSKKEAISIETNTVTKRININWSINKQTIDIAKLSSKGEKKGVIETSVGHEHYTFNLELCVPGWRRSQDGFSAFYLTVPREKTPKPKSDDNHNDNDNDNDYENGDNISDDENSDFIARYTVTFGRNNNKLTRKSSVRNDFDLGVGFPNFTEITTLSNAISEDILDFHIEIEIFECESTIKNCPYLDNYNNIKQRENAKAITSKLVEKMYNGKLNCDAEIIINYENKKGLKKRKCIKVHKCILAAASPVMEILFKHKSAENITSSIIINEWNINTVQSMIKFIYLGKIELFHHDNIDKSNNNNNIIINNNDEDGLDENDLDNDDEVKCELSEENKNENEDEMKDLELECPENARALFALFQIAEYYEIKELSIACCHELTSFITIQTCCLFLVYLDRYLNDDINHIKNYILRFMVDNIAILQKSKGYLFLLKNKPYLLDQLITKITENH